MLATLLSLSRRGRTLLPLVIGRNAGPSLRQPRAQRRHRASDLAAHDLQSTLDNIASRPGRKRNDLRLSSFPKRVHFGSEPFCRGTQRVIRYVRVTLCRGRVGVAKEAPDDFKAKAA